VIRERTELAVTEDAYCPGHELEVTKCTMSFPTLLEEQCRDVAVSRQSPCDGLRIADVDFVPGVPEARSTEDGTALLLGGRFYILYYDRQGQVQSMTVKWEQEQQLDHGKTARIRPSVTACGKATATLTEAQGQLKLCCSCMSSQGLDMISVITVGERTAQDQDRPAMVVRKAGRESLWAIAKKTGSTVESIRVMNGIADEPDPEQILLIPIL